MSYVGHRRGERWGVKAGIKSMTGRRAKKGVLYKKVNKLKAFRVFKKFWTRDETLHRMEGLSFTQLTGWVVSGLLKRYPHVQRW